MKFFISGVLFLSMLIAPQAIAGSYAIDPAHSHVGFSVKHMIISNVKGHFVNFKGTFEFDEKKKVINSAELVVDASSINTEVLKRDNHLRSKDFLDAGKFPEIIFKLKKGQNLGGNKMKVKGELTIHGVTKEIVMTGEYLGTIKDPWGNTRSGFTAETEISRGDFGLVWNKALEAGGMLVGDKVTLVIEVEGIRKK